MMQVGTRDTGLTWLGGEAHVRRQEARRLWRLTPEWRQGFYMTGALLIGSVLGGGAAAVACRQRSRRTVEQKDKGEPRMRVERPPRRSHPSAGPLGPLVLAFTAGAAVGAGLALMTAPHAGHEMRRRIERGTKTAQEELSVVVEETREAVGVLTKDARQTLRQTVWRFLQILAATRDAWRADVEQPERRPADE